ncbi:hypothetical protein BpHYR1_006256 [Brachionus plicatilis]|uniref:Uncharacterized protein n=1 Tax=Brachionus plicatilis TaxID=10195 RepID=A0A3M7QV39_BRAPC|nr:hypothetical protein BpHYR1_006256 [Brachionus plicatilis]
MVPRSQFRIWQHFELRQSLSTAIDQAIETLGSDGANFAHHNQRLVISIKLANHLNWLRLNDKFSFCFVVALSKIN